MQQQLAAGKTTKSRDVLMTQLSGREEFQAGTDILRQHSSKGKFTMGLCFSDSPRLSWQGISLPILRKEN